MKTIIILLTIGFLFIGCEESGKKISEIILQIDPDNTRENVDLSSFLEDSVSVIKLETLDDCLIADIKKIEFTKDFIFIKDDANPVIFQFDKNGKYIKSIGQEGQGPGEYIKLGDFVVMGDSLYIDDMYGRKIIIYSINNKGYRQYHNDYLMNEFIAFDRILYYITNYIPSKSGNYNLYRMDLDNNKISKYLQFDKEISDKSLAWGLNTYSSKWKNEALLIYPRDNVIYEITKDQVKAKYDILFTKRSLPSYLLEEEAQIVMEVSSKEGYIRGLIDIHNSRDYVWGTFIDGKEVKNLMIEKKSFKYHIGNEMIISTFGNLYAKPFTTNDYNEFIVISEVNMFRQGWEYIYRGENFIKEKYKKQFENLYKTLREDDNPILFKFKLKNKDEE